MCGACPGGSLVSRATAELNRTGRKHLLLTQLRLRLAPGCTLTLVGDGWALRHRTGRQEMFSDVEQLVAALAGHSASDWKGSERPSELLSRMLKTG